MKHTPHRLVLGITGGIAAYKTPLLIRQLARSAVEVKVVLTEAAKSLVGIETLKTLSKNPVFCDDPSFLYDMDHIRLAQWGDCFLICPATANTIAKIAHGIADNLLSTLALSFAKPLLIAPAMNTAMWHHPATQDNIALLKSRGVHILPVAEGELACGDNGAGRMVRIETIEEYVLGAYLPRCLTGKKVLISSGPTCEPVDPVRILTNRSSGKMGAALAHAALCMGASVTVVSGPTNALFAENIVVDRVTTAAQMHEKLCSHFTSTDICIMAAAVSDFRPKEYVSSKIQRSPKDIRHLELVANPDIAADLGKRKQNQYLAGFALETEHGEERAMKKMIHKCCDLMVYNRVDSSLDRDDTAITLLSAHDEPVYITRVSKRVAAQHILLTIAKKCGLYHE